MKKVTVIIPNYNGMKFMENCLFSIQNQDADTPEYEILVVDNGSVDGSLEMIREKFPQVRVISLTENTGFCHAANVGIGASDSDYVLLLNNDTRVSSCFVKGLYQAIEARSDAFSVSAKMLMWDTPDRIDDAGDRYCALGWAYSRGKGKPASCYEKPEEIFSSCGGAAIYRKKIFEKILKIFRK